MLITRQELMHVLDGAPSPDLTAHKTIACMGRDNSDITGFVLTDPNGLIGIVDKGAVRWLSSEEMWHLMHPQGGGVK